jgi:hypothetical protein
MRCQKAGRQCSGYEKFSKNQGALYQSYMGVQHSLGAVQGSQPQHPMMRLALDMFTSDPHRLHDKLNAEIFQVLLPQLTLTRPCVGAAAAALGAAYDMAVNRSPHTTVDLVLDLYLGAIRDIQDGLRRNDYELVPMLMAAFLLAAAESVQQQHNIAFNHVAGAFGMATLPTDRVRPHDAMRIGQTYGFGTLLSLFFSLDLQISFFTSGRIPGFPPLPVDSHMQNPTTIEHLLAAQPVIHQHCLHFIGNAAHSVCVQTDCVIHKLREQQSDLITWLNRWLKTYNLIINRPETTIPLHSLRHLQLLKAQTLTALVSTSNVKPVSQTSYDVYALHFDEIISLAESILSYSPLAPPNASTLGSSISPSSSSSSPANSATTPTTSGSINSSTHSFPQSTATPISAVSGIIHPLFHTARKYRNPSQRRRAIALLARSGIEGPLHGSSEALVASHIVAIEENGLQEDHDLCDGPQTGDNIYPHLRYSTPTTFPPEENRVCVAWLVQQAPETIPGKKGIWGTTFPSPNCCDNPRHSHPSPTTTTGPPNTLPPPRRPNSPFWPGTDPHASKRRWLRVSRRRRGPLGRGWGGEECPDVIVDNDVNKTWEGKAVPAAWRDWTGNRAANGGEIRMLDGDGICAWEEVLGEEKAGDWRERRKCGGVETIEL